MMSHISEHTLMQVFARVKKLKPISTCINRWDEVLTHRVKDQMVEQLILFHRIMHI